MSKTTTLTDLIESINNLKTRSTATEIKTVGLAVVAFDSFHQLRLGLDREGVEKSSKRTVVLPALKSWAEKTLALQANEDQARHEPAPEPEPEPADKDEDEVTQALTETAQPTTSDDDTDFDADLDAEAEPVKKATKKAPKGPKVSLWATIGAMTRRAAGATIPEITAAFLKASGKSCTVAGVRSCMSHLRNGQHPVGKGKYEKAEDEAWTMRREGKGVENARYFGTQPTSGKGVSTPEQMDLIDGLLSS